MSRGLEGTRHEETQRPSENFSLSLSTPRSGGHLEIAPEHGEHPSFPGKSGTGTRTESVQAQLSYAALVDVFAWYIGRTRRTTRICALRSGAPFCTMRLQLPRRQRSSHRRSVSSQASKQQNHCLNIIILHRDPLWDSFQYADEAPCAVLPVRRRTSSNNAPRCFLRSESGLSRRQRARPSGADHCAQYGTGLRASNYRTRIRSEYKSSRLLCFNPRSESFVCLKCCGRHAMALCSQSAISSWAQTGMLDSCSHTCAIRLTLMLRP